MASNFNRRDFLRGKAALATAADAVEAVVQSVGEAAGQSLDRHLGGAESPEAIRRGPQVLTLTRRAMACDFQVNVPKSDETEAAAAGMAALDVVERIEDQLTIYRDQSELLDLNRRAADEAVAIESRFFSLLETCGRVHAASDGAFDPTSGPLSRVWGFHRRDGRVPSEEERSAALACVGWGSVELDASDHTVRFRRAGIDLNVNSIGKGYALDRAAESLAADGVADSLMHGGRSTLLARGDNPLLEGGGWRTALRDPLHPDTRIVEVRLRNEAFSTSGSGTQFFEHDGRRFGHLIDPRTGWPAEGLFSASVVAPTAAEADALSTAAYILGIEGVGKLCERRPDVKALLLAPSEESGVAIYAFNFPEEQWRPAR